MKGVKEILKQAISLVNKHGSPMEIQNVSGSVTGYRSQPFFILYVTPTDPESRNATYMVNIWYQGKKVFNESFKSLNKVKRPIRKNRPDWMVDLFALE